MIPAKMRVLSEHCKLQNFNWSPIASRTAYSGVPLLTSKSSGMVLREIVAFDHMSYDNAIRPEKLGTDPSGSQCCLPIRYWRILAKM